MRSGAAFALLPPKDAVVVVVGAAAPNSVPLPNTDVGADVVGTADENPPKLLLLVVAGADVVVGVEENPPRLIVPAGADPGRGGIVDCSATVVVACDPKLNPPVPSVTKYK